MPRTRSYKTEIIEHLSILIVFVHRLGHDIFEKLTSICKTDEHRYGSVLNSRLALKACSGQERSNSVERSVYISSDSGTPHVGLGVAALRHRFDIRAE